MGQIPSECAGLKRLLRTEEVQSSGQVLCLFETQRNARFMGKIFSGLKGISWPKRSVCKVMGILVRKFPAGLIHVR